jgi:hypothetical protein
MTIRKSKRKRPFYGNEQITQIYHQEREDRKGGFLGIAMCLYLQHYGVFPLRQIHAV